jgi:predicted transposase/invertase (TIGR01784 family)
MLMGEYNEQEHMEVVREEAWEYGLEEGLEQGLERGLEQGIMTVARNALANGASIEFVQTITGLSPETIQQL